MVSASTLSEDWIKTIGWDFPYYQEADQAAEFIALVGPDAFRMAKKELPSGEAMPEPLRQGILTQEVTKHQGPGPHKGTGTPQTVHGGAGASVGEAKMLTALAAEEGGFTWDDDKHLTVMSGKAVSPYKDAEVTYSLDYWTANGVDIVKNYIKRNREVLAQPDTHLGAWVDDGKVYLDVSVVKSSHEEAAAVAREHDQLAYFDLDTFVQYDRNEQGEYVAA